MEILLFKSRFVLELIVSGWGKNKGQTHMDIGSCGRGTLRKEFCSWSELDKIRLNSI